jgi:hypothetical protein
MKHVFTELFFRNCDFELLTWKIVLLEKSWARVAMRYLRQYAEQLDYGTYLIYNLAV